jgi:hypothetical protein
MSTPFIEMPQRAAADRHEAAVPGGARRLARAAVDEDAPGHDVLRQADAGVPVHAHGRVLVHSCAVVARVAHDLYLDVGVDPRRQRVRAARVEHAPVARPVVADRVQRRVEVAQLRLGEVDLVRLDPAAGGGHQTGARSQL